MVMTRAVKVIPDSGDGESAKPAAKAAKKVGRPRKKAE